MKEIIRMWKTININDFIIAEYFSFIMNSFEFSAAFRFEVGLG